MEPQIDSSEYHFQTLQQQANLWGTPLDHTFWRILPKQNSANSLSIQGLRVTFYSRWDVRDWYFGRSTELRTSTSNILFEGNHTSLLFAFNSVYYHNFTNIQSTFLSSEKPTARERNAVSTPSTRSLNTRLVRLPCSLRVREDTTVSSPVLVVKPSQFSTRRLRPPRRLSWDWSVSTVRPRLNCPWRDVSTSSWVVTRSKRVKLCNSKRYHYAFNTPIQNLVIAS